jgi:uncharacterized Zn-finger protein
VRAVPVAPATVETSLLQISEVPVIMVSGDRVSCDGGTDPRLGHPRVYLNLHKGDAVSCPYCGLRCAFCFLYLCSIWICISFRFNILCCPQLSEIKGPPPLDSPEHSDSNKKKSKIEVDCFF